MKSSRIIVPILVVLMGAVFAAPAQAAWIWSPETGKWTNPKDQAQDTPDEQFEWAKTFYDKKDYGRAIDEFNKLTKNFPNSQMAAEAQYYVGLSREATGDIGKAAEAFGIVIDRYPYSNRVTDAIEHEFELAEAMLEGKKTKFLGVAIMPAQDTAATLYKHIVKSAPYGPFGAQAQLRLGDAYVALGDLAEAEKAYQKVVDEYPTSEYAPKARYQLARTSYRESQEQEYHMPSTDAAIKKFEGFVKSNPDDKLEYEANEVISELRQKKAHNLYETGLFYQSRSKPKSARIYYEDIVRNYPDTDHAEKAKERLAEIEKLESNAKPGRPWWRVI